MWEDKNRRTRPAVFLLWITLAAILFLMSRYSYLLFHSIAELFSIIIAFTVFVIGWHSREYVTHRFYLFLGIAYLFVGGVDLLHTLAYSGMGVFPGATANLPTQLWIAGRYLESFSLLAAPFLLTRNPKSTSILFVYTIVTGLLLASIFYWNVFPVCYIPNEGLTPFKIASEYVISAILAVSAFLFFRERSSLGGPVSRFLIASALVAIAQEMAFTLYVGVYDFPNLVGHYLKIVSYYLIYRAVIRVSFVQPFESLFRDLKQSEQRWLQRAAEVELRQTDLETRSRSLALNLLESEERFRGVFEDSPISINVFDAKGDLIEANRACLEMFGVSTVEDLRGFNIFDDPNLPADARRRMQRGETLHFVSRFDFMKTKEAGLYESAKSGIAYLATFVSPLRNAQNGMLQGYLIQMQDVSEAVHLDEIRQLSLFRTEALMQLSQMTDVSLDEMIGATLERGLDLTRSKFGYIVFLDESETILTMRSWSKETLNECSMTDKPRIYKLETTGLGGEAIRQRRAIIVNSYAADSPFKRGYPEGHVEIVRFLSVPVFDDDRIVAVASVGNKEEDYTETDAQQLSLLLEGMWRIHQRRLSEEQIRTASRTAQLYLDLMGHDIRNHMQAIIMSAEILAHHDLGPELSPVLELIIDSVENSRSLIEKVQATRGLLSEQLEDCCLDVALNSAVSNMRAKYDYAEIELINGPRKAFVRADRFLENLLTNILENAICHNLHKEVNVWISVSEVESTYTISISDNGPGIDDERKKDLFNKSRRYGGVGLHQALQIIQKYGGVLSTGDRIDGMPDQGAKFNIIIPKAPVLTNNTETDVNSEEAISS